MLFTTSLLVVALATQANAQARERTLVLNFTASAEAFRDATDEYRAIWHKEGARIVAAMERPTGLRFEPGPIDVSVYEGVSYSGGGGRPMLLRASYAEPTKRGTLVHELSHRLASGVPFKGDHHELIFLFLYDVWVDLWGQPFADEQVNVSVGNSIKTTSDHGRCWVVRPEGGEIAITPTQDRFVQRRQINEDASIRSAEPIIRHYLASHRNIGTEE